MAHPPLHPTPGAQGGEFAFVLLALANRLDILPTELNKVLIIVVVLSMALTPVLAEAGKQAGKWVAARDGEGGCWGRSGFGVQGGGGGKMVDGAVQTCWKPTLHASLHPASSSSSWPGIPSFALGQLWLNSAQRLLLGGSRGSLTSP